MARLASDLSLPMPLPQLIDILKRHAVVDAFVFGSYARGTAGSGSDLDLLVTFARGADPWAFLALTEDLDGRLPGGADVVTKLSRHFEPYVEPDLVRIL